MYFPVQGGTRRYKEVQGGTWWYKEQYKEVQDSMYWNVLACTNPGPTVQPGPVMLPCGWIRCCNSARPIARQLHLMTAMQAQACFNQPLVLPLAAGPKRGSSGGGVGGAGASAGGALAAAGAAGSAAAAVQGRRPAAERRRRVVGWNVFGHAVLSLNQ